MKIVWLPKAIKNLHGIKKRIAQDNPKAAFDVSQKIKKTVHLLKDHPYIGQPTDVDDIFEKQVPALPYLIPYRIVKQEVHILRVFHESQDNPNFWD